MNSRLPDQAMEQRVARLQGDLGNLVQFLVAGLRKQLSPYEIDAVEYTILYVCFSAGQITVKDLRELVPVDYGQISRVVSRLEDRGLVEKMRLRADRRVVHVRVTAEGQSLVPKLVKRVREYYALLVRGIDLVELTGCVAVMEKMIEGGRSASEKREV